MIIVAISLLIAISISSYYYLRERFPGQGHWNLRAFREHVQHRSSFCFMYAYIYIYIYAYVCMYVYIYIYIYHSSFCFVAEYYLQSFSGLGVGGGLETVHYACLGILSYLYV